MTRFRVVTTTAAILATVVVGAAPGAAAMVPTAAYRYWTYWVAEPGESTWTFASAGPASLIPADGSVQGWRFAVTTAAGTASSQPRTAPSFADICADTPATDGSKRVALVIDPGTGADAPPGQLPGDVQTSCVVADTDATGYQITRSVTTVRAEGSGLVCGVGGYPTGECAPVVDEPSASSPAPTTSAAATPDAIGAGSAMDAAPAAAPASEAGAGSPLPLLAVLVLAAAVGGALVWRRRRG